MSRAVTSAAAAVVAYPAARVVVDRHLPSAPPPDTRTSARPGTEADADRSVAGLVADPGATGRPHQTPVPLRVAADDRRGRA